MRGDLLNLNIKAFNKQSNGLTAKCFEIELEGDKETVQSPH